VSIGIPSSDDAPKDRARAGWLVPLANHFDKGASAPALYTYDFGDDWHHVVAHEGVSQPEPGVDYPRCIGGARRCPPEDCGGVHGYAEFLAAIADPQHPDHGELLAWVGGRFDPDAFDPAAVAFADPGRRWKKAFGPDA
jgi:hypothetical protein